MIGKATGAPACLDLVAAIRRKSAHIRVKAFSVFCEQRKKPFTSQQSLQTKRSPAYATHEPMRRDEHLKPKSKERDACPGAGGCLLRRERFDVIAVIALM
jgi:hypothetical protein